MPAVRAAAAGPPTTILSAPDGRQARAIAALQHHNILPIFDYGEQGDLLYLVLQYVEKLSNDRRSDKRSNSGCDADGK